MKVKKIVIVTDCVDIAYNELRGTYASLLQDVDFVEIEPVVQVKPFSVINGAFVLRLMVDSYPTGTVFSIILNPEKNRPERVVCRLKNKDVTIMTANTGVLEMVTKEFGIKECYEVVDPGFYPFGGKYVHTPTVAQIAQGTKLSEFGPEFSQEKLRALDTHNVIVHIDNFGLMKCTNQLKLPEIGDQYQITLGRTTITAKYDVRMMSNETGDWIIYPGSSFGLIEIGKVRENGAMLLGAKEGDKVVIEKSPSI